jgi:hypothetical protein
VGSVQALATDPNSSEGLYEISLQPSPNADGSNCRPVWLHVHTAQKTSPERLMQMVNNHPNAILAAHLKTDAQRNLGVNHVEQQRALGNHDVYVHRGPVNAEQLKQFIAASRAHNPRP